jgi:glycerol-3-phosphate dehydrogenase
MKDTKMDFRNRRKIFTDLDSRTFDILIIGAGITGAGLARDATMRGLTVALVDAADISAGTSSRSSKLIHGGSRYVAQGDVTVVRMAANERKCLRRIAPHLSITNPMVIPAKSIVEKQLLKGFIWTYEKLGNVEKHELHQMWSKQHLQKEEPLMRRSVNQNGALVFPEYLTDDARLTLANARCAYANGAVVATYAAARAIIFDGSRVAGAEIKSTLPGDDSAAAVRAHIVINAAGPWVDDIRLMEDPKAGRRLQLTKGIHVVVSRDRLPVTRTIIMRAPDKRGLFAVPRGNHVYIGTTDTFYPRHDYWPEITREDINYLLETTLAYLDVAPFKDDDIIALWAGLRPLLGEEGKKPSEISRRDEIMTGPGGLLSVAGGKLTSYRAMAEQTIDQCELILKRKHVRALTDEEPLVGGDFAGTVQELGARIAALGLSPAQAQRAAFLYGSEALTLFTEEKGIAPEVRHAVLAEGALTLEDYWVRRSARAHFGEPGVESSMEKAADLMGELLGWSEDRREMEIKSCRDALANEMGAVKTKKENVDEQ